MKKLVFVTPFLLLLAAGSSASAATGTFDAVETIASASSTLISVGALSGGLDSLSETRATGSFAIQGGAGSVVTVEVDGTDILGGSVLFNQANMDELAIVVASHITSAGSGYTASASGATVTVTAPIGSGASANGRVLSATGNISIGFNSIQNFSGGADGVGLATSTAMTTGFAVVGAGDVTLNIGGTAITLTPGETGEEAASSTAAQINADGGNPYTASVVNADQVLLTAKAAGSAGNAPVVASDLAYNGVAQVVTFTPALVTSGETFRAAVNGLDYDYLVQAGNSIQNVVEALAPLMDGNADVACTENDIQVTCTAEMKGISFTYSALVIDAPVSNAASNTGGSAPSRAKSGPPVKRGEVLGAMTMSPEIRAEQIAAVRTQLIALIKQLIEKLQAELLTAA